jgi:hypothetical protein
MGLLKESAKKDERKNNIMFIIITITHSFFGNSNFNIKLFNKLWNIFVNCPIKRNIKKLDDYLSYEMITDFSSEFFNSELKANKII